MDTGVLGKVHQLKMILNNFLIQLNVNPTMMHARVAKASMISIMISTKLIVLETCQFSVRYRPCKNWNVRNGSTMPFFSISLTQESIQPAGSVRNARRLDFDWQNSICCCICFSNHCSIQKTNRRKKYNNVTQRQPNKEEHTRTQLKSKSFLE